MIDLIGLQVYQSEYYIGTKHHPVVNDYVAINPKAIESVEFYYHPFNGKGMQKLTMTSGKFYITERDRYDDFVKNVAWKENLNRLIERVNRR